jgi:molybdopterin/thiamine biosynthesis adenylyltransferase
MENLNLSRQSKLVPYDKINQYTLKVFGVGSIGSHFVKTAAKAGFKNIEVYDVDKVEEENIAAQAFDFEHIGQEKVVAMSDIIKKSAGVEIITHPGLVDEDTDINIENDTIYCCFFDSFEGRKLVFNKLKEYPIIFVDGRIGKYDMRHYLIDCSDEKEVEEYLKSLNTGKESDLECGTKASAPINTQIAGMIVMNIINYITGDDYTQKFIGNAKTPNTQINILKLKGQSVDGSENMEG